MGWPSGKLERTFEVWNKEAANGNSKPSGEMKESTMIDPWFKS